MKIPLLLLFLFWFSFVQAQDTWIQKADFGGGERFGASGFTIGTKAYVGLGYCHNYGRHNDFWEWDQATDVWTQKADFGGIKRYFASCFSIGTKGYIGGGFGGDWIWDCKDFWEWDQATNTWTQKADFSGIARHHAIGFSIGMKGYIGTGFNYNNVYDLQDFWEWDPLTDTWTQKTDFPGAGRNGAVGFSIGTKGYIGTGEDWLSSYTGSILQKDFWEWDQSTDTWAQKADFGGTARTFAVGFSLKGKAYIGTGHDHEGLTQDFWEWDPATNVWIETDRFNVSPRRLAVGFAIEPKGYLGMGEDSMQSGPANLVEKDLWEFNPRRKGTPGVIETHHVVPKGYGGTSKTETIEINETEDSGVLKVFPNPASNAVSVNFSSLTVNGKDGLHVAIKNELGQIIYSENKKYFSGEYENLIRLAPQPKGIYFIEIIYEQRTTVKKIVLN